MSDAKATETCNLDDLAKISNSGKVFWDLSVTSAFAKGFGIVAQTTESYRVFFLRLSIRMLNHLLYVVGFFI